MSPSIGSQGSIAGGGGAGGSKGGGGGGGAGGNTGGEDNQGGESTIVVAIDPNEKVGPIGFSAQGWLPAPRTMTYAVFFENLPAATAPAQEVRITDVLDPDLDLSTFEMGDIAFGNQLVTDLVGTQGGYVRVPLTNGDIVPDNANLVVDIEVRLDFGSRTLHTLFRTIDPLTNNPPTAPLAGFLPPNVDRDGRGEGRISFSVQPRANPAHLTSYANQAAITFDGEQTIVTNTWINALDLTPPTSQISPRHGLGDQPIELNWAGQDDGSGVKDFTILVSENGAPYEVWLEQTTQTSAVFNGSPGNFYLFYVFARDNVGNVQRTAADPRADVNRDGCVDDTDLARVLSSFGSFCTGCPEDVTGDGVVDDTDLAIVLVSFGSGC